MHPRAIRRVRHIRDARHKRRVDVGAVELGAADLSFAPGTCRPVQAAARRGEAPDGAGVLRVQPRVVLIGPVELGTADAVGVAGADPVQISAIGGDAADIARVVDDHLR